GAVLLRERPLRGLLGGMLETPSSPWEEAAPNGRSLRVHAPFEADWRKVPGTVEHIFTHFHLELLVYCARVGLEAQVKRAAQPERCRWMKMRELPGAALPSLMRKIIGHALNEKFSPGAQASAAPPRAKRRSA
ncbi:MAG: NUDIX domain-containing protein, partial [Methyloceanibacter sp.]